MKLSPFYRLVSEAGSSGREALGALPAEALEWKAKKRRGRRSGRTVSLLVLGSVLGSFFLSGSAHAQQVTVTPTVTPNGGGFHFSYSVFNGAPNNLTFVAFQTPLLERDAATNLAAPTGFETSFDSGDGFISFRPDDPNSPNAQQRFAPGSTVAPFTFDSPFSPLQVTFQAFDVNGTQYNGMTLAPGGAAAVPEASTIASFGGLLALGGFTILRRNRTRVAPDSKKL